MGGGRYDGLVELMGGPSDAGGRLGRRHRAAGDADRRAAGAAAPDRAGADRRGGRSRACCVLAEELRDAGLVVELGYSGNLQRRMRRADRIGARAAVLLGDDELARGAATVRDLDSGEQSEVPLDALAARLAACREHRADDHGPDARIAVRPARAPARRAGRRAVRRRARRRRVRQAVEGIQRARRRSSTASRRCAAPRPNLPPPPRWPTTAEIPR